MASLPEQRRPEPAALTAAFLIVVGMWAVAYVGRLPVVDIPSPALAVALLATVVAGGAFAGRRGPAGARTAAVAGAIAGVVNLLVLGSVLGGDSPGTIVPSALVWIPGSIALTSLVATVGALVSGRGAPLDDWSALFVRITVAATFLLLAVGGLVTSHDAGLAVVDWPNSFGYNMFLYPLSKMTGGIYYEHAHRLFGALVGLTTVVMAIVVHRGRHGARLRWIAWMTVPMVIAQGFLGGLRVTGVLTFSTSPEDVAPRVSLAVVHGVFGQIFFVTLVVLAVATSRSWNDVRRGAEAGPADRALGGALVGLLVVQLVLGALQRHLDAMLILHITLAGVIAPLGVAFGTRSWGRSPSGSARQRFGIALVALTGIQVMLGVATFLATATRAGESMSPVWSAFLATSHQWCGAAILAVAVCAWMYTWTVMVRRQSSAPAAA